MSKSNRPLTLDNFIGQKEITSNLNIFIQSAIKSNSTLDHILLSGPPGLGKTSLAKIIANEMSSEFQTVIAPAIKSSADLVQILMNLKEKSILFIDEIHRLHPSTEEMLYSAMEDFKLNIVLGDGVDARVIEIDIPKFTLIGATTRAGMISNPLRDRFGIKFQIRPYTVGELKEVVKQSAKFLDMDISDIAAEEIAKRSRGTPRVANSLLNRAKDFSVVNNLKIIEENTITETFKSMQIDNMGLTVQDSNYLNYLANNTRAVGIETIAAKLLEDIDSVKTTIEPYLLQIGFIQKTPKGRIATQEAISYLKTRVI